MKNNEVKVIGLVGGMGPHAGSALFNNIINNTKAKNDQNHLSVILMSFPNQIGDRTLFIEGGLAINPAFNIVKVIEKLENAGAEVVGISCNTCYSPEIYDVILEELEKINSSVKMVHMPYETCRYIKENQPQIKRIGLMTSNGTYISGLYKKMLELWGYEVIIPDFKFQNEIINRIICDPEIGIKAGPNLIKEEVRHLFDKALNFFKEKESDAIILGCTELPLVLTEKIVNNMIIIDSSEILAKALIREASYHEKEKIKQIR